MRRMLQVDSLAAGSAATCVTIADLAGAVMDLRLRSRGESVLGIKRVPVGKRRQRPTQACGSDALPHTAARFWQFSPWICDLD